MKTSVIVYGPQGCGKTTNAERLKERFRLSRVVDEWEPGQPILRDTLYLTNQSGDAIARATAGKVVEIRDFQSLGLR